MIPPLPGDTPQVKIINECIREIDAMNIDTLGNFMHKDFSNDIHPKSLGAPARNKEAYIKHYAEFGTGYGVGRVTYARTFSPTFTPLCS